MKSSSPLRYPGGKSQLYSWLIEVLEKNNLVDYHYIEPFAGGAGLAIQLLLNDKVKKITINDYDLGIYAFWYSITTYNEKFIRKIKRINVSIEEWYKQKDIHARYTNKKELNANELFKLGFATFFLNRTNHSGIILAGPIGGYNQNGNYLIDCRFGKKNLIKKIEKIGLVKAKIEVTNNDVCKGDFFASYDRTLYFIDPPYYEKGKQLYKNFFTHHDHENLANSIINDSGESKYIITYDDCKEIKKIYEQIANNISEIDIRYSIERKRKAKEIMISNLLI
jgi:DNA adenine methylase